MNDAQILIALGDVTKVAKALSLPASTIANWKSRGIPWHMRGDVRDLARRKRVKLPADFLINRGMG